MPKDTCSMQNKTAPAKGKGKPAMKSGIVKAEARPAAKKTKKGSLLQVLIAQVEAGAGPVTPISLVAIKKLLIASRGMDFTKTAHANQLKKALSQAVEQGLLQKQGSSYSLGRAVSWPCRRMAEPLASEQAWYVDLGEHLYEGLLGPFWFDNKQEATKFRNWATREWGMDTSAMKVVTDKPSTSGLHEDRILAPNDHVSMKLEDEEEGCSCGCGFKAIGVQDNQSCQQFTIAFFKSHSDAKKVLESRSWY